MKLTIEQMQQQIFYAAQHKKCKCDLALNFNFFGRNSMSISFVEFEGASVKYHEMFNIFNENDIDIFNNVIKILNGEIDPFKEENK